MYEHNSFQRWVGTGDGKHSFGGRGPLLGNWPLRNDSPSTASISLLTVVWTGQCIHPKFQAVPVWELYLCASVAGCPNELPHWKAESTAILAILAILAWLCGFWSHDQRGWRLSEIWRCNQGGICSAPAQVWSFFQKSEWKQSCPWLSAKYLSFGSKRPQALAADESNPEQHTDQHYICHWGKAWEFQQKPSAWTGTASLTLPAQAIQKLQTGSHTHELVFS